MKNILAFDQANVFLTQQEQITERKKFEKQVKRLQQDFDNLLQKKYTEYENLLDDHLNMIAENFRIRGHNHEVLKQRQEWNNWSKDPRGKLN